MTPSVMPRIRSSSAGKELDEDVVTLGHVVDLVSELALTHLLHLIESSVLLDKRLELFDDSCGIFLTESGVDDIHQLVLFACFCHF